MFVATQASRPERGTGARNGIHFVYDDRAFVAENIARIVGQRSYGSVMRNRRSLADTVLAAARRAEPDAVTILRDSADVNALKRSLRTGS